MAKEKTKTIEHHVKAKVVEYPKGALFLRNHIANGEIKGIGFNVAMNVGDGSIILNLSDNPEEGKLGRTFVMSSKDYTETMLIASGLLKEAKA